MYKVFVVIINFLVLTTGLIIRSKYQIFNSATTNGIRSLQLPGFTEDCQRCLCWTVSKCNLTLTCSDGLCGPLQISRAFWIDAGRVVLPEDDPDRDEAFPDCALSYHCAMSIIKSYFVKFGQDCNGDGVTNCDDFIMMHFNGGYNCGNPIYLTQQGRLWLQRYAVCRP